MAGERADRAKRAGRGRRAAGPPPDEAALQAAAITHLGRFAATEAGLRRVLERRVDRWARAASGEGAEGTEVAVAEARAAAARVARRLAAAGTVDDAGFAAARAARLARSGRSSRAIAAHLRAKGVAGETAEAALPGNEEAEIDAALAHCRRRRAGPFAVEGAGPEARLRALAGLARAGFPHGVAEAALDMPPEEAERRLLALRRG